MAKKKELTQADVDAYVSAYAKRHEISEAEAKRRIMATGVSRLKTLKRHGEKQKSEGGGAKKAAKKSTSKKVAKKAAAKPAKAAKKTAKKASAKKPAKAAPKAAAAERKVVEGEEG